MPKTICVKCGLTMRPVKCGVDCIEYQDAAKTSEYEIWRGDILECTECKTQIAVTANQPFVLSHQPEFARCLALARTSEGIEFY